jgi:NitT/TauT family transport system ATP-binding protein/sulfonate transport system ATP-binding protein
MANGPDLKLAITEKRFAVLPQPLFADLRLDIAASSVVALVGPSGVGKSSLLRMIAGIDTDYSGTITIAGRPAADAPPAGFVFQDPRLLPWLTMLDNILAIRPETRVADALKWLERVGLKGYEKAFPHELSGGMQRRVALARALSVNPKLLLLDEPFVSLDRHLVAGILAVFINVIEAEKPTVVLVTHLPEDAARIADRAIVLDGRPARIAADLAFDVTRAERTAMEIVRLTEMLASYSAETPA